MLSNNPTFEESNSLITLTSSLGFSQTESVNKNKFRQLKQELPTPNVYRTASGAPGHEYYQQKSDRIFPLFWLDSLGVKKWKQTKILCTDGNYMVGIVIT